MFLDDDVHDLGASHVPELDAVVARGRVADVGAVAVDSDVLDGDVTVGRPAPPTPFMFQFVTKRFWVLPAVRAAPATSLSSVMRDEEGSPAIRTPDLMAATTLPNPKPAGPGWVTMSTE
jgi:hypothetical protein